MSDPAKKAPPISSAGPGRRLRRLLALLALVAAMAAGSAWLAGRGPADEGGEPFPVRPPGFWSAAAAPAAAASTGPADAGAEERARLVSLPYLGGRAPADRESTGSDAARGVVRHLPERAWPGVNLYNSGHGPEAVLVDMTGEVLHRWRYPFEQAFPSVRPTDDSHFFRRVHLFPDGRLLALYQTGGLIFLDRESRPVGRCPGNFYNDLWVDEEPAGGGRIWTLAKEAWGSTEIGAGAGEERLDDFLALLRYDGEGSECREERRISLTRALERSPFARFLADREPRGDVLHANTVVELGPEVAEIAGLPEAFAPGRLLVSLREIDVVAVVDPESGTAVWARRGPWRAQHEPSLLSDGRLLLFDNRGNQGYARLLEVDPATGEATWSHGGEPPASFGSAIAGSCARLPNGNTLATLSVPGRALELDASGRVVWELRTPHRAGPDDGLIAMLFEVQRLPRERVERWLR
jgi:hypothetical protein